MSLHPEASTTIDEVKAMIEVPCPCSWGVVSNPVAGASLKPLGGRISLSSDHRLPP